MIYGRRRRKSRLLSEPLSDAVDERKHFVHFRPREILLSESFIVRLCDDTFFCCFLPRIQEEYFFVLLVILYLIILGLGFCFNVNILRISSTLWQEGITLSGIKKRFVAFAFVDSIKYLLRRYKFQCRI